MLCEFWKNYKGNVDISVTFLLMGQMSNGSIRIEVVRQSNLSSTKKKFVKINCEHIYSLQRTVSDLQILALAEQIDVRFTTIKCKESFIKLNQNLFISHLGAKFQEENHINVVKTAELLTETTTEKQNLNASEHKFGPTTESSLRYKIEEKVKKTAKKKEKKNKGLENSSKKIFGSYKAGQQNIFFRAAKEEIVKENSGNCIDVKSTAFLETNIQQRAEKTEIFFSLDDNTLKFNNEREIGNKTSHPSTSKRLHKTEIITDKKANHAAIKKRKRIISSSDSNTDESVLSDFDDETNNVFQKSSGSVEKFKKSSSPQRNKEDIQTKDRTFLDEDGFLVTQKIPVHEEAAKQNLINTVTSPETRTEINVKNNKTKQSTLISFLKKK
ncbi:uncharacterized protein LOC117181999 [Belonocnema kinseyi]|uniref:uncharacterized protein LOC117181999 n=1 Tax=Belonocnema kinseyi TaxID=2817044 RepID=UPI00143DA50F|nr:uncharacterized protein LOC117181999 [Belonocnema kinseyi]